MPALVNIKVGSLRGTSELDGTTVCPLRAKKSKNVRRISLALAITAPTRRARLFDAAPRPKSSQVPRPACTPPRAPLSSRAHRPTPDRAGNFRHLDGAVPLVNE